MPSLPAIPVAERELGLPVPSATTATVYDLLVRLGLEPEIPDAGTLLGGEHAPVTRRLGAAAADGAPRRGQPLPLLVADDGAGRYSDALRAVWPEALKWIAPHPDSSHLRQAVVWVQQIDPAASEPLPVAALTHDMERLFPGGPKLDKRAGRWDDPEYNNRHTRRSAAIVAAWLREQGLDDDFIDQVAALIVEHEFGGSPEGDKIQAADSLSFLDVNGFRVSGWVIDGEATLEVALRKVDWMYDRIRLPAARALAAPLHERCIQEVRDAVAAAFAVR